MAFAFGQNGTGWTKADYNASSGGRAVMYNAGYVSAITGTMTTAYLECGANYSSSTVKLCVYDSSDVLLGVSDPISVTSAGLKSGAMNAAGGGLSITSGATYKIVAVSNAGYWNAKRNTGSSNFAGPTWAAANFSYASPPATLPAGDDFNATEILAYIEGTAGSSFTPRMGLLNVG